MQKVATFRGPRIVYGWTTGMRIPSAAREWAGRLARWSGVVGLNYHRIGDGRGATFDRGLWSATAEDFDRQVRWLKTNFDVVAPRDLSFVRARGAGRHVLITFDDGYADNYHEAFPVLRAHGVPASFFVATGFIDAPSTPWWDRIAWVVRHSRHRAVHLPDFLDERVIFDEPHRERAIRRLLRAYKTMPSARAPAYLDALAAALGSGAVPVPEDLWMTWDMLREMLAGGMTIGGHTVHHPILARMPRSEQAREIGACRTRLADELGIAMHAFAYPVGNRDSFNEDTRACLREAGVRTAFSYYGGFRTLRTWDDFDIPRLAVEQDTTFEEFRACVMFPWVT